jgi:flagellar M-ring protein FliF
MEAGIWARAPFSRKLALSLGALLIAAAAAGAAWWALSEPYAVLFADLEAADAGRVIDELEGLNREYALADDGRSVLVRESEVHDTRIRLMSAGVPLSGGVGFEIFDDAGFGMTEFAQRINYQRALEGELTRTIMALDEVRYARVHVVIPDGGLFATERDSPSAAVTVFLEDGMRPSGRQIKGVQHLVAAAVPRLEAAQVTVTDQNGVTLSANDAEGPLAGVSGQLEKKIEVERYLTQKANEMLAQAFGPNQAIVSIDALLDFNESTTTIESVVASPGVAEAGVVRRRESQMTGADAGPEGAVNSTREVEYEVGRSVEQSIERAGRIVRLGIGVVVPADTSEERREAIRDVVAVTVGYDASRGDEMAVRSFTPPRAGSAAAAPLEERPSLTSAAPTARAAASSGTIGEARSLAGAGVVVLLLVVLLAGAFMRRGRKLRRTEPRRLERLEREQLVAQIQRWVKDEPAIEQRGTGAP